MRDRRDYLIAALAVGLVFCLGILVGGMGDSVLPAASAQDGAFNPEQPQNVPNGAANTGGGITISPNPNIRPGTEGRTVAPTASDSNSNNRFVAVTCPVGSGESVLFVLDAKTEQLTAYRFLRNKGLQFVGGRKIDYDLRITGYKDESEYTRDEMKRLFDKQLARAEAKAVKSKR
jgi:hypothetical protein